MYLMRLPAGWMSTTSDSRPTAKLSLIGMQNVMAALTGDAMYYRDRYRLWIKPHAEYNTRHGV